MGNYIIYRMDLQKVKDNPKKMGYEMSIGDLEGILSKAQYAYHTLGEPIISDHVYDTLFDILEERDPSSDILDKIGAEIEEKEKIKLPYHLGSMDKVKPDSNKLERWVKTYTGPYVISDKEDGVSCLLTFDPSNNKLKLYTRGNSTYGQDISYLQKYMDLPKLSEKSFLEKDIVYAVRGEIIMKRKDF